MSNATRHSYVKGAEGTTPSDRVNRQGSAVVVDQYLQWALEGRVYFLACGTETTPLTAVAYDQDLPEFILTVPSGTTAIPLFVNIQYEASAGTNKEIIVWCTTNAIGAGTSSALTQAITNLRTDAPRAAVSTAAQLYITNAVTLTNYRELYRTHNPIASIAPFALEWSPRVPPILVGPSSLGVQISGTTTLPTYFMEVYFAEFETADIT